MSVLGITSSLINESTSFELNYETNALLEEGRKEFEMAIAIDPRSVIYSLRRGSPALLQLKGQSLKLNALLVRRTSGCEEAIATMANCLGLDGCFVVDGVERFTGARPSKLLTTILRHRNGVGTDSYFAFCRLSAQQLVNQLWQSNKFPILSKPPAGSGGKGVRVYRDRHDALSFIDNYFKDAENDHWPVLFQPYIEFIDEYRILVIGKKAIGCVKKIKKRGSQSIALNAAQGAVFEKATDNEAVELAEQFIERPGVIGFDIGRDKYGTLHVIEANHSPLWRNFEVATGINVAREIIKYVSKELE